MGAPRDQRSRGDVDALAADERGGPNRADQRKTQSHTIRHIPNVTPSGTSRSALCLEQVEVEPRASVEAVFHPRPHHGRGADVVGNGVSCVGQSGTNSSLRAWAYLRSRALRCRSEPYFRTLCDNTPGYVAVALLRREFQHSLDVPGRYRLAGRERIPGRHLEQSSVGGWNRWGVQREAVPIWSLRRLPRSLHRIRFARLGAAQCNTSLRLRAPIPALNGSERGRSPTGAFGECPTGAYDIAPAKSISTCDSEDSHAAWLSTSERRASARHAGRSIPDRNPTVRS
jgi:hypothetical protein